MKKSLIAMLIVFSFAVVSCGGTKEVEVEVTEEVEVVEVEVTEEVVEVEAEG